MPPKRKRSLETALVLQNSAASVSVISIVSVIYLPLETALASNVFGAVAFAVIAVAGVFVAKKK